MNAIFYLQIYRPWAAKAYTVRGPYTLPAAHLRADREIADVQGIQSGHSLGRTPGIVFDWSNNGTPQELARAAAIGAFKLGMTDGRTFYVRMDAEVNQEVADMWRAVRAGDRPAAPTYFVWSSEAKAGQGKLRRGNRKSLEVEYGADSRKERRIHAGTVRVYFVVEGEKMVVLPAKGVTGRDAPVVRTIGVLEGAEMNRAGVFR
ncbi:hypothetical protein N0V90_011723 [Kalmusia sp. IMI 367209]|nr:hypothetical protein N0V90_011723 [Kalmusia sp. IMI 367209]